MTAPVNQFDFVFIIDTTGSMGNLIHAAQQQMVQIVDTLSRDSAIDIRFGVVEFRDHPPQDNMVYKAYELTDDLAKVRKTIHDLSADGGGDEPEAVFAGVFAAIHELTWRPHARRMAVLVGDAPPHGVGTRGDGFPRGCPSGESIDSISAKSEAHRLTLYSIGLNSICEPHFERMSRLTGGRYFRSRDGAAAMDHFRKILTDEFHDLEFDRQIHDAWSLSANPTIDSIAEEIDSTPGRVGSAICRLQSRGLLQS